MEPLIYAYFQGRSNPLTHRIPMGRTVYLPTFLVDFYGFSCRYIYRSSHGNPMDPWLGGGFSTVFLRGLGEVWRCHQCGQLPASIGQARLFLRKDQPFLGGRKNQFFGALTSPKRCGFSEV